MSATALLHRANKSSDTLFSMAIMPNTPAKKRAPAWIWLLLALPYLGLCFPSLYARATPALFGFPFFYWYQFAWVVLTSVLLYIVYRQLKSH
jgi:hypothetical protein